MCEKVGLSHCWKHIERWKFGLDYVEENCTGCQIRPIRGRMDSVSAVSCFVLSFLGFAFLAVAVPHIIRHVIGWCTSTWHGMSWNSVWVRPRPISANCIQEQRNNHETSSHLPLLSIEPLASENRNALLVSPAVTRLTVYRGLQVIREQCRASFAPRIWWQISVFWALKLDGVKSLKIVLRSDNFP